MTSRRAQSTSAAPGENYRGGPFITREQARAALCRLTNLAPSSEWALRSNDYMAAAENELASLRVENEKLRGENRQLEDIIREAFRKMQEVGPQLLPLRSGTVDYLAGDDD